MGAQHAERRRAIEAALLDYHRLPGKHTLALRQPALLFASVRDVLQLAADRSLDDDGPPPAPPVLHAARFFIRTALLRPDADHYTLLGVTREADTAAIKDHYRALMRLTHPDFAKSLARADWPADAATRINGAYEVLSSPDKRHLYDEQTAAPPAQPMPAAAREAPRPQQAANRAPAAHTGDPRRVLRHLALGFGALGGLALALMWMATAQNDRDVLVQRRTPRVDKLNSLFGRTDPAPGNPADTDTSLSAAIARALPAILGTPAPAPAPVASAAASLPKAVALTPAPAASAAAPDPVVAIAPPAETAPAPVVAASAAPPSVIAAAPAPVVAAPPAPAPPSAAPAVVAAAAPAAPAALRPAPPAGPTMRDVQSQLMRLVGEVESGWGDNLIAQLDFGARSTPAALAVAREFDNLCDGVRPVKIAKVDFKGASRDGRLIVTGQLTLNVRDASAATRQFALQAEFVQRDGAPVLTRLALPGAP